MLCNACVNAVLVVTTEVDQTVLAFVAATLVTGGDAAGVVTAAGLVKRTKQGLFRVERVSRRNQQRSNRGDPGSSACTYEYPFRYFFLR